MTRHICIVLFALIPVLGMLACSGSGHGGRDAYAPDQTDAPAEVSTLRLSVSAEPGAPPEIMQAVETSLVRAGFDVVDGGDADLTGTIRVQQTREEGFFKVYRNGQLVVKYRYVVTLQLSSEERVIVVATAEFVGEEGEVDRDELENITRALSRSGKLRQFARQHRQQQAVAAREAKQEAAEERNREYEAAEAENRRKDEAAWIEANPRSCNEPQSLDACKGVQLYLATFPDGAHVEEARQVLKGAAPKLEQIQADDNAWNQAGADACVPGGSADACIGVELYLQKFPAGLHQVEAREVLRNAGVGQ